MDDAGPIDALRNAFPRRAPPSRITQRAFDLSEEQFRRLIDPETEPDSTTLLWYCFDLRFVKPQKDLFDWVFPLVLERWRRSLLNFATVDESFYTALTTSNIVSQQLVLETVLPPSQRGIVHAYIRQTILDRIRLEQSLHFKGSRQSVYGWFSAICYCGCFVPDLESVFRRWFELESEGKCVAALQYVSCLMYGRNENPIFAPWTPDGGGGPPTLWELGGNGTPEKWLESNAQELGKVLSVEEVERVVRRSSELLDAHPQAHIHRQMVEDWQLVRDRVEKRIPELCRKLAQPDQYPSDWDDESNCV